MSAKLKPSAVLTAEDIEQVFGCPGCGERIKYNLNVKLKRLIPLQQFLREKPLKEGGRDEEFHRTSGASCPCCGKAVQLLLKIEVVGVADAASDIELREEVPDESRANVTREQMQLLAQLRKSGVVKAFADAIGKTNRKLRNVERYFLTWMQLAAPCTDIAPGFRQDFAIEFQTPKIQFFIFQDIVGVVADGALRCFILRRLLKRGLAHEAGVPGSENMPIRKRAEDYQIWRRTKFGYVVGRGPFWSEMRRQAAGSFDTTGL